MTTLKSSISNLWTYFTHSTLDNKLRCRICNKSFITRRNFNLKKHLRHVHKIEIRTDSKLTFNKVKNQLKKHTLEINDDDTRDQILDVAESLANAITCPGTPAVKVEFETEEATAKDVTESLGHETTFEEDFVEHENLPSDDEDAENEENSGNPSRPENFEKTNTASRKRIIRERPENIKRTKPASVIIEDPLDENQTSIKDDNFEQWALKKKQLLEIELLEMRNYKFKLELLEIEQRLKLAPSKFTRSIRSVE